MDKLKYIKGYSKSYTHRFIILSWLNNKDIVIKKFTKSDDVMATLNALYDDYRIILGNLFLKSKNRVCQSEIHVGESGSTLRFLIPIMLNSKKVNFITAGRLIKRPLNEFKRLILSENGCFDIRGNILTIKGDLKKNKYKISTEESSQFVSGMLMASRGRFEVIYDAKNSTQYIDITKDAINIFKNNLKEVYVPIDMSNYAFFYALFKKGLIEKIETTTGRFQNDKVFVQYVNDIRPRYNLKNSIDIAPILAAYLSTIDGKFEISGLKNLKFKESNRLKEILRVLKFFGVSANTNGEDKIFIMGSSDKKQVSGKLYINDHRICHMALFLKYFHKSNIKILGLASLKKSDGNIYRYFKRREDV